jgi:hypothetical protein
MDLHVARNGDPKHGAGHRVPERLQGDTLTLDMRDTLFGNLVIFLSEEPPSGRRGKSRPESIAQKGDRQGDDSLYPSAVL